MTGSRRLVVVSRTVVVGVVDVLLRGLSGEEPGLSVEVALIGVSGSVGQVGDRSSCSCVDVVLDQSDEALEPSKAPQFACGEPGR